jgi:hypothetical protein
MNNPAAGSFIAGVQDGCAEGAATASQSRSAARRLRATPDEQAAWDYAANPPAGLPGPQHVETIRRRMQPA